jgi:PAS domain S-box-containing protein
MHHVSTYFQAARSKAITLRAARPLLLVAAAYVTSWSYLFIATFLGAKPPPAPLFLPGAILLSALLLSPLRHWWRFVVAAFVIQLPILAYLHVPPMWNVLGFTPDAVEPIVAVILIRRYLPLPLRFASLREVGVYTVCVAAAVLVAATLGSAVNAVLGGEPYWTTWMGWYLSDILACLVLAPAILLWIAAGAGGLRAASRQRYTEAALLYGGLLLMGLIVFNTHLLGPDTAHALIYLPVPLLVWAAVRFGPRGIASALALIVVLAVPAVANALGPFASQSAPAAATLGNVFTLQLFLLAVGVPLFFLAALMQERVAVERTLRASEAHYQAVVETQTEMITRYWPDTTLTFVNDATCRYWGKSREELLGTSILADMPEDAAMRVREMIEALLAQPHPGILTIEHEARFHDGSLRWQQWVNRTILDADGQVVELQGIGRDITERKRAEEALQASEARYRTVVRNLPQTVVLFFDAELRHTFADGPGLQALGLTPEGLEGRTVWETLPGDLAAALAPHYAAARSGQTAALDVEYAQHIYRIQVVPMPANTPAPWAQTPVGMVVLRDITEQRRARDELVRERTRADMLGALSQQFQTLAEHSPDLIARFDPAGRFVYVNQAGADRLSLPAEEWVGKTFADLGIPRAMFAPWAQALRDVVQTRAPRTFDIEVQVADGQVRSLHVRFIPEFADDDRTLLSVLGIATDVSALKHAEARLAEQASELETIFESQADGVGVFDLEGHCVRANMALRDLLGLDADRASPARLPEERTERLLLLDEQDQPLTAEQWPLWRVLRGEILAGASAMEARARTVDGRELWISTTGAPIHTPDGQVTGAVLIARDVTARRALERQVAEQAAAAERTRLAHELHDTVTQDIYSAGLLADSITRNWPEHRAEAEEALAQLPRVIRGALAGLRVLLLELRPTTLDQIPLAALLRQLGEAMSTRAKVPIAVRIQVNGGDGVNKAAEPPLPPAVKLVFYRVAQEALMNAAKYANAHAICVQLWIRGRGRDKGTIELEIADDGQGFDPCAISAGHFGLAIMRERAQAVGATVQVRSQPGQGTQIVATWRSGR